MSSSLRIPAADGQRHETDLRSPSDNVQQDRAIFMAGGDVEKHQLVGSLLVVPRGHFDRVAGVFEVDEIRSLDHAAVVDVEARNDPLGQHAQSQPIMPSASMLAGKTIVHLNHV